MRKILVIEDEDSIRSFIVINLKRAGYAVTEASSGEDAFEVWAQNPDILLMVVDVMLPGIDGYEICRRVRARGSEIGIIMLTARAQEMDKVMGLMTGADDYITKPFNPVEVLARVKSQLRRFLQLGAAVKAPSVISVGGIELDHDAKRVTLDGEPVALTPKEYDILYYLMQHPGKVYTPAELYSAVWNEAPVGIDNTVAVHIRHLREKLEIDPSNPRYLKVVWGKGYKLEGDRQ